jgi:hypothetical protein
MMDLMRRGYLVGFGASPYRKGVFQLGTVNNSQVNTKHILYVLMSIGLTLARLGVEVKLEAALKTADAILQELTTLGL